MHDTPLPPRGGCDHWVASTTTKGAADLTLLSSPLSSSSLWLLLAVRLYVYRAATVTAEAARGRRGRPSRGTVAVVSLPPPLLLPSSTALLLLTSSSLARRPSSKRRRTRSLARLPAGGFRAADVGELLGAFIGEAERAAPSGANEQIHAEALHQRAGSFVC